jgi:hypothetical protein
MAFPSKPQSLAGLNAADELHLDLRQHDTGGVIGLLAHEAAAITRGHTE